MDVVYLGSTVGSVSTELRRNFLWGEVEKLVSCCKAKVFGLSSVTLGETFRGLGKRHV